MKRKHPSHFSRLLVPVLSVSATALLASLVPAIAERGLFVLLIASVALSVAVDG